MRETGSERLSELSNGTQPGSSRRSVGSGLRLGSLSQFWGSAHLVPRDHYHIQVGEPARRASQTQGRWEALQGHAEEGEPTRVEEADPHSPVRSAPPELWEPARRLVAAACKNTPAPP